MTHYAECCTYSPTACRCGAIFTPKPGKGFHLSLCRSCVAKYEAMSRRVNCGTPAARRETPVRVAGEGR